MVQLSIRAGGAKSEKCAMKDDTEIMFHTKIKRGINGVIMYTCLIVAGYCLRLSVQLRWNENWCDLNMQTCVHACPHMSARPIGDGRKAA